MKVLVVTSLAPEMPQTADMSEKSPLAKLALGFHRFYAQTLKLRLLILRKFHGETKGMAKLNV